MIMKRSDFLRASAMAGLSLPLASLASFASAPVRIMGAQLWTIREDLKKDLPGSLKKLAALGYNEIEIFGYNGSFWGRDAKTFRKICEDNQLRIVSSHYDTGRVDKAPGTLVNGWEKAVEDAHTLGCQFMLCAWLLPEERISLDLYKELVDMLNKAAEPVKKAGMQFAYHGHNFEFDRTGGVIPYDYILEHTDKDLMKMECDIYWFTKAGQDPITYFKKHPGRFPLWHVKDMDKASGDFTEVGQGSINFDAIFAERKTAGLSHWFVEQDECKRDPFDSLRMSRDYIAKKNW
jgi:sugar phosphate isomerase/epimerase